MSMPGVSWRRFVDALAALTLVALPAAAAVCAGACAKPERVQMGQVMRMGQFVLRADSMAIEYVYYRDNPLEVHVYFTLGGGNRFDRAEFSEVVSRRGPVFITTSAGWRQRGWLSCGEQEWRTLHLVASAPRGSSGYALEIGNPYGEPRRFILDLGK